MISQNIFWFFRFFTLFVIFIHNISAWNPAMIGGMKLGFDGEVYSFTTDVCPGGVFFKAAIHVPLICSHGYFLKRPDGCKMEGNEIISGTNFACNHLDTDERSLSQAFIPVTNSEYPTQHTITFYDDAESLKNLRKYTYVKGLEGEYEGSDEGAAGVIVANSHKTPLISIGGMCYEGRSRTSAAAFIAAITPGSRKDPHNFFTQGCAEGSYGFPWDSATRFPMTTSFSAPQFFEKEIKAKLPAKETLRSELKDFEIWNGIAYCLQENTKVVDGKLISSGLVPQLDGELKPFCGQQTSPPTDSENNSFLRRKRNIKPLSCVRCCADRYMPDSNSTATKTG